MRYSQTFGVQEYDLPFRGAARATPEAMEKQGSSQGLKVLLQLPRQYHRRFAGVIVKGVLVIGLGGAVLANSGERSRRGCLREQALLYLLKWARNWETTAASLLR